MFCNAFFSIFGEQDFLLFGSITVELYNCGELHLAAANSLFRNDIAVALRLGDILREVKAGGVEKQLAYGLNFIFKRIADQHDRHFIIIIIYHLLSSEWLHIWIIPTLIVKVGKFVMSRINLIVTLKLVERLQGLHHIMGIAAGEISSSHRAAEKCIA